MAGLDTKASPCFTGGMDATTTLTTAQARRIGRWLVAQDMGNVRVVENLSYGEISVAYSNLCGNARTIETMAEFAEVKKAGGRW